MCWILTILTAWSRYPLWILLIQGSMLNLLISVEDFNVGYRKKIKLIFRLEKKIAIKPWSRYQQKKSSQLWLIKVSSSGKAEDLYKSVFSAFDLASMEFILAKDQKKKTLVDNSRIKSLTSLGKFGSQRRLTKKERKIAHWKACFENQEIV